jgi:ectoine hydroxylase-related dioxygenase (phytanoyl-CoA dioxygenase family)
MIRVIMSADRAVASHRYSARESADLVAAFRRDGYALLKEHFARDILQAWHAAFAPRLQRHVAAEGDTANRGAARYYVTLPFAPPFADPRIYADPDILTICRLLVGEDMFMCQLATDTPLKGSRYQDVHRDAPPLFPEAGIETPPFQLAVNFPLVDVSGPNGPTEIIAGTHEQPKEIGFERLARNEVHLQAIHMRVGDVLIRDVRGLHRGTPNTTDEPRPMVVIGYSRRWLLRPEVCVRIGRSAWESLSDEQRYLLRFNPIVPDAEAVTDAEHYRDFAF